jgi:hypothetical protein
MFLLTMYYCHQTQLILKNLTFYIINMDMFRYKNFVMMTTVSGV